MRFERGANYEAPEIRQMWPDGPSRMWSRKRGPASYVCQGCYQLVVGVYRKTAADSAVRWLCAGCANLEQVES